MSRAPHALPTLSKPRDAAPEHKEAKVPPRTPPQNDPAAAGEGDITVAEAKADQALTQIATLIEEIGQVIGSLSQRVADLEAAAAQPRFFDESDQEPAGPRQATPLCEECGAALPVHFDQCSNYREPGS